MSKRKAISLLAFAAALTFSVIPFLDFEDAVRASATDAQIEAPRSIPTAEAFTEQRTKWKPPVGIPAPPFGIVEPTGPANCFVDRTNAAASDDDNPLGTPSKPRKTLPPVLNAGDVCEVRGTGYSIADAPRISLQGTAQRPATIRAVGNPEFAGSESQLDLEGQYFVVEGLKITNTRIRLRADVRYAAIRGLEITGWKGSRSTAMLGFDASQVGGSNVVIYRNHIHDNGPLGGTGDIHAFKIGGDSQVSQIWYVDNLVYRNAGDAVQVGSARSGRPWPHHIYIGRNTCYEDRENCVDIKKSADVIVSQNDIRGYRDTGTSRGEAIVVHDGAERVWVINNVIRDSGVGIAATGQNDDFFVVGNVLSRILQEFGGSGRRSGSAVFVYGMAPGKTAWVVNNTIRDSDGGLICAEERETCQFENNIVAGLRKDAPAIGFTDEPGVNAAKIDYNLVSPKATYQIGRYYFRGLDRFKRSTGLCSHCKEADPQFTSEAELQLNKTSAGVDAGIESPVYERFRSLYSHSIANDQKGRPRPMRKWDLGAYESE